MEATAKLFPNGRSQAVRIPKALQFEGVSEVVLSRQGDALLVVPLRKNWVSFAEEAPPDFMEVYQRVAAEYEKTPAG